MTGSVDLSRLSEVEGHATTGEETGDLAVELAAIELLPADNGLIVAKTQLTEAVGTNDVDLIGASQATSQNREVVSTNSDIEDLAAQTEDGRNISGNSLTDVLGVGRDEADMISTTQVGQGQTAVKRVLVLRARVESIQGQSILEVGQLKGVEDRTVVEDELVLGSAGIGSELDTVLAVVGSELETSGLVNIDVDVDVRALSAELNAEDLVQRQAVGVNAITVEIVLENSREITRDAGKIRLALAVQLADAALVEDSH